MNRVLTFSVLIAGLLLVPGAIYAHHGSAGYDMEKMTVGKAKIKEIEWTSPHCQIHFDFTDEKGAVEPWTVEAPPPSMLTPRNWTRKSLNAGDEVTIYFHAAKNGAPVGIIQKVVFPNGEILRAYPDPK